MQLQHHIVNCIANACVRCIAGCLCTPEINTSSVQQMRQVQKAHCSNIPQQSQQRSALMHVHMKNQMLAHISSATRNTYAKQHCISTSHEFQQSFFHDCFSQAIQLQVYFIGSEIHRRCKRSNVQVPSVIVQSISYCSCS